MKKVLLVLCLLLAAVPAFAGGSCPSNVPTGVTSCYYIDYVSGSDSNSGTTEAAPWQHSPGMHNATGSTQATPGGHTPGNGEGWIFKGGVTRDYNACPMNVPWGSTSASTPDYMGYDPAWYTGTSWSRPIFNDGGATGYDSTNQNCLTDIAHRSSHVIVDNIRFTGLYWSGTCSQSGPYACGYISQYAYSGNDVGWELKNLLADGWSHCAPATCPLVIDPGNSSSLFWAKQDTTSSIHDSVVDGYNSSQDCCNAMASWIEYNNYITGVDNAQFGEILQFHDNTITGLVNTFMTGSVNGVEIVHGNCVHPNGGSSITMLYWNNLINCAQTSTDNALFLMEEDYAAIYAFNDVLLMDGQGNGFQASFFSSNTLGGTYTLFNNTHQCGQSPAETLCVQMIGTTTHVNLYNNFAITGNGNQPTVKFNSPYTLANFTASPQNSVSCSGGTGNPQVLYGGIQICAPIGTGNGNGNLNYTQTYPFAPMDATASATVGKSPALSTLCATIASINTAAGQACLYDTSLGVGLNTASMTVIYPNRTPLLRPLSNTQNGAYETPQQGVSAPSGLTGVVN